MTWTLAFHPLLKNPILLTLTILFAAACVGWTAWPVTRGRRRWQSAVLRFVLWTALLLHIARPYAVLAIREASRRPLAVLVDQSLSMSLPSKDGRRSDSLHRALSQQSPWNRLEKAFDLHFFTFSNEVASVARETLLRAVTADGSETHLYDAIEKFEHEGKWAGVVLLTDGVDTERRSAGASCALPCYTFYPDSAAGVRDTAISSVSVSPVAYSKTALTMNVGVEATGVSKAHVRVRVSSGQRVYSEVEIPPDRWEGDRATVELSIQPDRVEKAVFQIEVPPFPDEVTLDNNVESVLVNVLRDRLRVLHVSGRPDWDERFLRGYLKENPNLDLVSFFILRTPRDDPEAAQEELSLIPFPYRDLFTKELAQFDAVIFQNFDFSTYFEPFYLKKIAEYVREGGAFFMIGGNLSFAQGAYRGTPIEDILPVHLNEARTEVDNASVRATLRADASLHPVALAISPWIKTSPPELWGYHRTQGLAPGAVSILENASNAMPILAVREVEAGRSAALLADSTWRWAFHESGSSVRLYRDVMGGILSWLARERDVPTVQVRVSGNVIEGESVELRITALSAKYVPQASEKLRVTVEGGDGSVQEFTPAPTNAQGETSVIVKAAPREFMKVDVRRVEAKRTSTSPSEHFLVLPRTREFRSQKVDIGALAELSRKWMDHPLPFGEMDQEGFEKLQENVVYRTIGTREIPLWDHWILYFIIGIAASLEWWLRRRHGAS